MPTYEYQACSPSAGCSACRDRFEVRQSMQDPPLDVCPQCGGRVQRLMSLCGVLTRPSERAMLSDRNLREKGFTKFVNEGEGRLRRTV